jgi:hypothetical protein
MHILVLIHTISSMGDERALNRQGKLMATYE